MSDDLGEECSNVCWSREEFLMSIGLGKVFQCLMV